MSLTTLYNLTHTCPHDGRVLIPVLPSRDLYECGKCHHFFEGETLLNEHDALGKHRLYYSK